MAPSLSGLPPGSPAFFPLDSADTGCSRGMQQIYSLASYVLRCEDGDSKEREADSEKTGRWRIILERALALPQARVLLLEGLQHTWHRKTDRQAEVTFNRQIHRIKNIQRISHFLVCYFKSIFLINACRYWESGIYSFLTKKKYFVTVILPK